MSDRPRRHLTEAQWKRGKASIVRAVTSHATRCQAVGWVVVGKASRLRIQILVERVLLDPPFPVGTIALPRSAGGGLLKLCVLGLHPDVGVSALPKASPSRTFAPGFPASAVSGDRRERCGVAGFFTRNGRVFALTAGHVFSGKGHLQFGDTRLARVVANLLPSSKRIDAALCELLPAGLDAARDAAGSPTWCDDVHVPEPADEGQDVVFLPTHVNHGPAFKQTVAHYTGCLPVGGIKLCDLVTTPRCTFKGDSGSALIFRKQYYGLCSGPNGSLSCFTAVAVALQALKTGFGGLLPWQPS